MTKKRFLRMAIDIGGTFTDTVLMDDKERIVATNKTATTPASPSIGALKGAKSTLESSGCKWSDVKGLIHGTTLATNALIERKGALVATITTAGFRDILEIAYERRYSQYDINIQKPDYIVPRSRAFTIGGRIDASGRELSPLNTSQIADLCLQLTETKVETMAICLLHAYANPIHELQLRELLLDRIPELTVSLSHEISPEAREFDRLCTTIANAYIQPLMSDYILDFEHRFNDAGLDCPVLMMTAGGGMTTLETAARLPVRLVESGPAGGAILAARIASRYKLKDILSFDMGGTTAKLCLVDDYEPQKARKFEIGRAERFIRGSGMPVRIPVLEMIEIGAGGGSIASVDRLGRIRVGPESAGAIPGPVAFNKGGTKPTVTDSDIVQGYINPSWFAEGRLSLDCAAANEVLSRNIGKPLDLNATNAALSVSEIVDESMASAARMHAVESGKDLQKRVMIAFGGNGPLHATRVARRAQVKHILIPRDPGVGSAVGFLFAPVSFEIIRSRYETLETIVASSLNEFFDSMLNEAEDVVRAGAPDQPLRYKRTAFMRYRGQGHEIEVEMPDREFCREDAVILKERFEAEYKRQFSRVVPGMDVEILNWGLYVWSPVIVEDREPKKSPEAWRPVEQSCEIVCDVTGEMRTVGIFDRFSLSDGDRIKGPALIVEPQTTTLVSADFHAQVDSEKNIWLTFDQGSN